MLRFDSARANKRARLSQRFFRAREAGPATNSTLQKHPAATLTAHAVRQISSCWMNAWAGRPPNGLACVGLVGYLSEAKRRGLTADVNGTAELPREKAGFWCS
jgi:hypothetical protein